MYYVSCTSGSPHGLSRIHFPGYACPDVGELALLYNLAGPLVQADVSHALLSRGSELWQQDIVLRLQIATTSKTCICSLSELLYVWIHVHLCLCPHTSTPRQWHGWSNSCVHSCVNYVLVPISLLVTRVFLCQIMLSQLAINHITVVGVVFAGTQLHNFEFTAAVLCWFRPGWGIGAFRGSYAAPCT